MPSILEPRSLKNIKSNGDSQRARRQPLPAAVNASPRRNTVNEADPILPRRGENNAKTGDMVSFPNAFLRPSTTLQTSVRPTETGRSVVASRSVRPTTTGRPLTGFTGFRTIRPLLTSAASRTGRPLLGPSGPPPQPSVTRSSRPSLIPMTTTPIPNASGLPPFQPVSGSMGTPGSALPDQTAVQPMITATPTSGIDAGSIVGYILLALVGVAALIGGYFFIKKTLNKRENRPERLVISAPSTLSGGSSVNEAPMVMARSHPDIAARLGAIAARAERGEPGQMTAQPPPSRTNQVERANPFAHKFSAASASDQVPLVLARSYPGIAAELGAIAARAERGEPSMMAPRPRGARDEREGVGFPFAENDIMPTSQQTGRSAANREPSGSTYTERSGVESPIVPDLPNGGRRPWNVR